MLMNKILRYSFVALLAMVFAPSFAEDIIWQEDFSSYAADAVPAGGTYNYVCVGSGTKIYDANLAGGTSPELLVGKSGGSFTATINLGDKSGDMFLSFKCNKNITIEVTGGTLGSNTGSGNDYVYPITGASGSLTIVFKNTLTSNARLDNIKLYQGAGKKPAGLSWGTSARTVTINADDNVFPTLSNANNLTVTYDSSDKTVATINSEGTISLISAGSTVISAEFAGDDTYEAAKVTYTLTVNPAIVKKQYTIASTIESGKNYLIVVNVNSEYKVAKKITSSYGNLLVASATYDEGVISFNSDNAFTFTSTADGWTIQQADGKYLYQTGTYNNFNVSATPAADAAKYFDVVAENGAFKITNKTMNKYVQYVPASSYFGCFASAQTDAILPLLFVESNSTDINAVKAANAENGVRYNLAGQKVDKSYKGVVIMNGKKMIQK